MSADSGDPERRVIEHARVVTPDRVIEDGYVSIRGTRIEAVGSGTVGSRGTTVDADGRLVLPGFVDLHGDELERYLFPREGDRVATPTALVACDRANVAAGITTKFHAVAFENAPGERRSVALAREVIEAVDDLDGLVADARVHARCELGDERAVEAVVPALDEDVVDLVSLMNHLPDRGQFDDARQFARRYGDGGGDTPGVAERVHDRRRRVTSGGTDGRVGRIVRGARAADVAVASHDDEDPRRVDALWDRGVSISEYPVTMSAARRASRRGMVTAMGAPNVVRGESLYGNLSAVDAIRKGVVSILCSDYRPSSLLESVFVDTDEPLPARVRRVSAAPADAVGLDARGRVAEGARADLVVVAPGSPPRVTRAFVGGTEVYRVGGDRKSV